MTVNKSNKDGKEEIELFAVENDPNSVKGDPCDDPHGRDDKDRVIVRTDTTSSGERVAKNGSIRSSLAFSWPLTVADDGQCLTSVPTPWPAKRLRDGTLLPVEGVEYEPGIGTYEGRKLGQHPVEDEKLTQWPVNTDGSSAKGVPATAPEYYEDKPGLHPVIYKPCVESRCLESTQWRLTGPVPDKVTDPLQFSVANPDCDCNVIGTVRADFRFELQYLNLPMGSIDPVNLQWNGYVSCVGSAPRCFPIWRSNFGQTEIGSGLTATGGGSVAFDIDPKDFKSFEVWASVDLGAGSSIPPQDYEILVTADVCYQASTSCC